MPASMMAEDKGAEVRNLLWLLIEQTRDHAILLLDPENRVTWANPGAEHILGWSAEEVVGGDVARFFTPEDIASGLPEHEREIAISHGSSEDDRWHMRSDGLRFWASGALIALRGPGGELLGFGKILRNRTDVKEQLETLRNQAKALSAADRHKSQFLSKLSHELRNPLTPLVNAVQLLRRLAPDSPDLQYPVELIGRQVEILRRLVDDLLDVTRINAGKVELRCETIELHGVLERAVEATHPLVEQRRQSLDLLVPPASIPVVADPARLHQVFVNLITNAAKYTPEGGRIWVKATIEGSEAVVRVEDTGIGIARERLSSIFDLFTQVDPPASQGGLGIGLALVKDLVALHGGTVQVHSEGVGKGSELAVRLPLARS